MKQFLSRLLKFLLIALIPFTALAAGYLYFDPFKVLRPYSNYSYSFVIPNRDYISTEMFLQNEPKQHYNSFVFGSSRTLAFRPSHWTKYLPAGAKPFMLDASAESVYGIDTKLKLLDSMNVPIDNALIVICRDMSFKHDANHEGHLFIKHPATSGENKLDFQLEFFKAHLNPKFLTCFYSYVSTMKFKPFMQGYIENRRITYDSITNEINIVDQEEEVTLHPEEYYQKRAKVFYPRIGERVDSLPRINKKQQAMLQEIHDILEKKHSNYKVVLSPIYEQMKFNAADMEILNRIFSSHIYDFTGMNAFTAKKTNYYENTHFRPSVGDSILANIYP